jgi:tetratricopeptide (TPR) repeat protein
MAAVPEQGRLEEQPLPRLLLELHRGRFGGALRLSRNRVEKRFLFHEGAPVYAESNLASEGLAVQLARQGQLQPTDSQRVQEHARRSGGPEAAALLELQLLSPQELLAALRDQLRLRLVDCFGWPSGEFQVDPESEPPGDSRPLRSDVHALLQEGIEAHWSPERILADLAPRMECYPRPGSRFEAVVKRLERDAALDQLVASLDGARTLWQLLQLGATPRALAAAWVLDASEALTYADTPLEAGARGETEAAEPPVEAEIEIVVQGANAPAVSDPRPASRRGAARAATRRKTGEALRSEILEKFERLAQLDRYELLGVARDADLAAIKRAYHQAAKTYHPDALARSGLHGDMREMANKVFAAIGKAHAVLTDPQRRRDYDAALATPDTDEDASRLVQAETLFRKGEILLRQGNFRGALEFLAPAVELWPQECAYRSALGWALYKKAPPEPEAAQEHLEAASQLDPDDAETWFRLSVVLRAAGDTEAAENASRRASSLQG